MRAKTWGLAVGLLATVLSGGVARAAVCAWQGASGGSFSPGANWSCGGTPGSGDDVYFDPTMTGATNNSCFLDVAVNVKSITFQNGYTATVTAGANTVTVTNGWSMSTGTFSGASGNITIGGNLSLTGGAFTASVNTTQLGGAFNKAGGAFNANGGTIFFSGSSALSHTFGGSTLANVQLGFGTSGLVGYWKLDETSGTTAVDSSGSGNDGTWSASGVSRTASVPGTISFGDPEALTLDGSSGYVTLGVTNLPANNAPQSISLWFQGTPNANNQNMLAMSNVGAGSAVQLGFRGSSLIAWNYGGGTLVSTAAPTDSAWHQVIYTYDGATDRLYLDGALAATSTTGTHQSGNPTSAYLGTYSPSMEMFGGSLDDVRVYSRALSTAEVTILAAGSSPSSVAATNTFNDAFACTGSFNILAGAVTGTSTLTVGGNWFNAGTYSGTGGVTLNGTSAGGTLTSGGASFGALTINGSGGIYSLKDPLSVTGNLTIASGAGLTGAQAITVGGSWSNAGAFSDVGVVTLTSASPAATISSGGGRFSALTINGTGTYTLLDRLWVPGGTITLTNGTLNGGSAVIHVGAFSMGAGSFAVGSSTVVFDGLASQSLPFSNFAGLRLEAPAENNLVGYWKLDEGQGTTLQDVSGNGNTGAASSAGVAWGTVPASIPSPIGFDDYASLTFDGSSGYAQLGANNIPGTSAAVTISAWVYFTSVGGNQNMVVLAGAGNYLQFGLRNGAFTAWPSGAGTMVTGPAAVTGGWHHAAYTYDGSSVDTIYVDGVPYTGSFTHQGGATTAVYLGTFSPPQELLSGALDDVRIYNVALTASQVAQLAAGRYAGTGGYPTTTLSANTTVSGLLALDAGVLSANGRTMTASSATAAARVSSGTYTVGAAAQSFAGGLTVQPGGVLTLASSGGSVQIGSGKTLTVDGTLNASNSGATIEGISGAGYTFQVGSTSSVTPVLNISGLAIQNTSGGMQIGASTSATTTFTRFDNIAFSGGTGAQYLLINAKSLFLSSSGCSFDSGSATGTTTTAVTAVGDGTGDGETRAIFGGTSCATNWALSASDSVCGAAAKSDDDSDGNGIADSGTASTNGAIVQFTRAAEDDTAGSVVGFPTAAFDWSTFTYYSTYVALHNAASGSNDVIYVRDELGNPLYSWTVPAAGEAITGTPQWTTIGSTHYLFVATSAGHVYKLIDTATGTTSGTLSLDGTSWATNPYDCACTISTPLAQDASNLYFGSTTSNRSFFTVGQASESIPSGSPITIGQAVTNNAPSIATIGSTAYAFLGLAGAVIKISALSQTTTFINSSPGVQSIFGRIVLGTNGSTTRVYAGDDGGTMWALDAAGNFTTSGGLWKYAIAGDQIKSSPYYDQGTDTIQYGTQNGAINVLGGSGAVLNAGYPYTPSAGDAITAAPLYYNGVLVVGSTGGSSTSSTATPGPPLPSRSCASTTSAHRSPSPASGSTRPRTATWSPPPTRPATTGASTISISSPTRHRAPFDHAPQPPRILPLRPRRAGRGDGDRRADRRPRRRLGDAWPRRRAQPAVGRALGGRIHRRALVVHAADGGARAGEPGGGRRVRRQRRPRRDGERGAGRQRQAGLGRVGRGARTGNAGHRARTAVRADARQQGGGLRSRGRGAALEHERRGDDHVVAGAGGERHRLRGRIPAAPRASPGRCDGGAALAEPRCHRSAGEQLARGVGGAGGGGEQWRALLRVRRGHRCRPLGLPGRRRGAPGLTADRGRTRLHGGGGRQRSGARRGCGDGDRRPGLAGEPPCPGSGCGRDSARSAPGRVVLRRGGGERGARDPARRHDRQRR